MNSRFLPMGAALGALVARRAAEAGGPGTDRGGRLVGAGCPLRRELRPLAAVRGDLDPVRHLGGRDGPRGLRRRRDRRSARARPRRDLSRLSSSRCSSPRSEPADGSASRCSAPRSRSRSSPSRRRACRCWWRASRRSSVSRSRAPAEPSCRPRRRAERGGHEHERGSHRRLRRGHRGDQGGRTGRPRRTRAAALVTSVIVLLAPALLAALVVTPALADGERLAVGAETGASRRAAWSYGAPARWWPADWWPRWSRRCCGCCEGLAALRSGPCAWRSARVCAVGSAWSGWR